MKLNISPKLIFPTLALLFLVSTGVALAAESCFTDGTLLKGSGPEVYVMEDGFKRWIVSPEVFNGLSYDWKKIIKVKNSTLAQYPTGRDIDNFHHLPDGSLVKGSGPEVYLIKNGRRCWIPNPMTFNNLHLRWENIVQLSDEKLRKIYESKALPVQEIPKKYPETWFLESPSEFSATNRVTFKFSGQSSGQELSSIKFETLLEGYDKNWQSASQGQRTITLEQKDSPYVFFVRAKDKEGNYDPTPARHSFYINTSPYFGKIKIRAEKLKESDPNKEYISLYNQSREVVDITSWRIKSSDKGSEYVLPEAKEFIGLRYFEKKQGVKLPPGGRALIISGYSPAGWSFRLNKCTGYLNNYCPYYPSLPKRCPTSFEDNLYIYNLSPSCRKLIKGLTLCQEPDRETLNTLERSCRDFILENINYQACLKHHKEEIDFLEKTWYLYLAQEEEIWDNISDELILKDKMGLVVDRYQY